MTFSSFSPPAPPGSGGLGAGDHSAHADGVCILLRRDEIDAGNIGRVVDELMCLSDSDQLREHLAHRLHLSIDAPWPPQPLALAIDGPSSQFLRKVHAQWPYWLHFLAPQREQWGLLRLALSRQEPAGAGGHGKAAPGLLARSHGMMQTFREMTHAVEVLHKDMGLAQAQSAAIVARSWQAFDESIAFLSERPPQY